MKKLKKFAALLLVGVMALALLTACGGGGDGKAQKARTQGKMAGILEIQLQIQAGDGQIKKHCGQKGQGHMDRGQELHFSRSVRNENGNQQEKERQICQSRFPLRSQAGSSHGNSPSDEKAEKASGEEGPQDQEK